MGRKKNSELAALVFEQYPHAETVWLGKDGEWYIHAQVDGKAFHREPVEAKAEEQDEKPETSEEQTTDNAEQ